MKRKKKFKRNEYFENFIKNVPKKFVKYSRYEDADAREFFLYLQKKQMTDPFFLYF